MQPTRRCWSSERPAFVGFIGHHPSAALHLMGVLGRGAAAVDKLRGIRNLNEIVEERLGLWDELANAIAAMATSTRVPGAPTRSRSSAGSS